MVDGENEDENVDPEVRGDTPDGLNAEANELEPKADDAEGANDDANCEYGDDELPLDPAVKGYEDAPPLDRPFGKKDERGE